MAGTPGVTSGARTPEELETLFEDALLLRDRQVLTALFETGATLAMGSDQPVRGGEAIARAALARRTGIGAYVADPRRVLLARDSALVVTDRGVNVMQRGADGAWRYAIVLHAVEESNGREKIMAQETIPSQGLQPVAVGKDEGDARWWFGSLAVIKASVADTGGQMAIIEITEPPGAEASLHVHHREDEGFWILEGSATFEVGDTTIEAEAGDYLFGPRDIPHGYTVGDAGCRMLFIMTPGGMEELIIATSEPAASRTLPPPPEEEPDWEHLIGMARAYGVELLG
jgi:mannose-6-phosphate isomerase-like protein (cupin superfamily)